jgi:hypothetical protein
MALRRQMRAHARIGVPHPGSERVSAALGVAGNSREARVRHVAQTAASVKRADAIRLRP